MNDNDDNSPHKQYGYSLQANAGINQYDSDRVAAQKIYDYANPSTKHLQPSLHDTDHLNTNIGYVDGGSNILGKIILGSFVFGLLFWFFLMPVINNLNSWQKDVEHKQYLQNYKIKKNFNPQDEPLDSIEKVWEIYKPVFTKKEIMQIKDNCYFCSYNSKPNIKFMRQEAIKFGKVEKFDKATTVFLNEKYSNDGGGYTYNFVPFTDPNGMFLYTNKNWTNSVGANPPVNTGSTK